MSVRRLKMWAMLIIVLSFCLTVFHLVSARIIIKGRPPSASGLPGFKTNTLLTDISLDELVETDVGRDGVAVLFNPDFEGSITAGRWLARGEPVIAVESEGVAKAYPLQIMIWHRIVNDKLNRDEIIVTFSPFSGSVAVYQAEINAFGDEFGYSGFLYNSNMLMYDDSTESFWSQLTGRCIVGSYLGEVLTRVPFQIMSFGQFEEVFPDGRIMSDDTGFDFDYGVNPYPGYDTGEPLFFRRNIDERIEPMERLIIISQPFRDIAYPHAFTRAQRVYNDFELGVPIVIFHIPGARSALDNSQIALSRQIGSRGMFRRTVDGEVLTFRFAYSSIFDEQTQSEWDISGLAINGPLEGERLEPVPFTESFAFSWLAYRPATDVLGVPAVRRRDRLPDFEDFIPEGQEE